MNIDARLTDDQVASLARISDEYFNNPTIIDLAREVQAYRALRPDCPTLRPINNRIGPAFGKPDHRGCPDCTDGKMPLDKWVALLVADGERLRSVVFDPGVSRQREAIIAHDAVLKMVPKVAEYRLMTADGPYVPPPG